jgi:acetyl esterase
MATPKPVRRGWRQALVTSLFVVATLAIAALVVFKSSPLPSVWVIRWAFERDGVASNAALSAYVPPDIRMLAGLRYDPNDPSALLDIYRPSALDGRELPIIVWIHGGGYVAGSRGEVANYAQILASDGFAVIAVDYPLAPEIKYPAAVRQIGQALAFLSANAARLQLDRHRFILAGDSAGAQLAAQLAALASSPNYAEATGLHAGIERAQLLGVVLFCGPYDGHLIASQASSSWFSRTVVWSYFGSPNPSRPLLQSFSVVPHVTPNFPPVFISVGNDDALAPQSVALADALQKQGVRVETLFYPASHSPPLEHEYQFDLSLADSREALTRTRTFLHGLIEPATLSR